MMYPQSSSLSHYLLSFMFYTLTAVGMMYAVFYYLRTKVKNPQSSPLISEIESAPDTPVVPQLPLGVGTGLEVESVLPMENQQSLYVLRAGRERFLISVSGDKTTLLSKLESASVETVKATADLPWFKAPEAPPIQEPVYTPKASASQRFMQSLQWLISARSGSNR